MVQKLRLKLEKTLLEPGEDPESHARTVALARYELDDALDHLSDIKFRIKHPNAMCYSIQAPQSPKHLNLESFQDVIASQQKPPLDPEKQQENEENTKPDLFPNLSSTSSDNDEK